MKRDQILGLLACIAAAVAAIPVGAFVWVKTPQVDVLSKDVAVQFLLKGAKSLGDSGVALTALPVAVAVGLLIWTFLPRGARRALYALWGLLALGSVALLAQRASGIPGNKDLVSSLGVGAFTLAGAGVLALLGGIIGAGKKEAAAAVPQAGAAWAGASGQAPAYGQPEAAYAPQAGYAQQDVYGQAQYVQPAPQAGYEAQPAYDYGQQGYAPPAPTGWPQTEPADTAAYPPAESWPAPAYEQPPPAYPPPAYEQPTAPPPYPQSPYPQQPPTPAEPPAYPGVDPYAQPPQPYPEAPPPPAPPAPPPPPEEHQGTPEQPDWPS